MVNAWSLAYDILNGTLDEDYPIMNKEKKEEVVTITGGDNIITSLESDEYDPIITTSKGKEIFNVPDDIEHSDAWYDYTRNDPDRENPFTNPKDRARADRVVGKTNDDTITITGDNSNDSVFFDAGTGIATGIDLGDLGDYSIDLGGIDLGDYTQSAETFNINIGSSGTAYDDPKYYATKPQPDLNYKSQKYQEDIGIKDLKDYVSSTYRGHYTNKNSDTQTLDLIHSVGDAEAFCRSNALKYLSRYDKKGTAKQDILKAMHYCLLLYYFSGNTKEPDYTNTRYETF